MKRPALLGGGLFAESHHAQVTSLGLFHCIEVDAVVKTMNVGMHNETAIDPEGLVHVEAALEGCVRGCVFAPQVEREAVSRSEHMEMSIPGTCRNAPRGHRRFTDWSRTERLFQVLFIVLTHQFLPA
jgi:hypothetical protein